ncbi:uncharacterized protein SAPINGB_P005558 [Magnusiomyces paraingens]|uniref:Uncharacterized protein n=1 Tax=Magnusiomyces paraingens TaxID=2606893 RepID=A0A5E8C5L4_9ASCO|nr:uncharacterized protein SAPINGB_P005558 [Saprochaete ingens]VVT57148.1 unnamed protein product [Saprochaete ingens]
MADFPVTSSLHKEERLNTTAPLSTPFDPAVVAEIAKQNKNPLLENLVDVLCGSVAGSAGKIIEHPFDTVKVRLQSQPDSFPPQFKGPVDCIRQTFQNEGFMGFYRGMASPIIGAALENASLFLTYNAAQKFIRKHWYPETLALNEENKQPLPLHILLLCGSFSGCVTSFILTPIELIKCRMQIQMLYSSAPASNTSSPPGSRIVSSRKIHTNTFTPSAKVQGPIDLILDVYRKEGVAGFWRGQTGTLLREAGGSAAWFGAYEYVNQAFRKFYKRDKNTTVENMIAGACSGVMFNLSLFPADTIKSRMQTEAMINKPGTPQMGFFEMGKRIYKVGGIRALYRGCGITISRAAPSSAIIFVTYEKLKDVVHGFL